MSVMPREVRQATHSEVCLDESLAQASPSVPCEMTDCYKYVYSK